MDRDDLMGPDGENIAVHSFLRLYQKPDVTIEEMRDGMAAAGWVGGWPEWVSTAQAGEALTRVSAQAWIRHLMAMETAPALVAAAHPVRDAQRALKSIRRVIDQDTAREGEKATLALFLDDDVNTLQQFVDAQRGAGGEGSQGENSASAAMEVRMPRNVSEQTLLVTAAAVRAGLCELTGSDGHVVKKVFNALHAHLVEIDDGQAPSAAEYVLIPVILDDDLWRAGIEAFRKALNLRTGLDMFTAKQTYQGMYDHLAARRRNK